LKHAKGQRAARPHGEKRKLGQLMRQGCQLLDILFLVIAADVPFARGEKQHLYRVLCIFCGPVVATNNF
jgi:hypothetical protein